MALSYIWAGFFVVGLLSALGRWLYLGDAEIFQRIVDGTFESSRIAVVDIALPLAGIMTLWLGILAIGERAGLVRSVARITAPFFMRIFPEVPPDHPAIGHMVMNFAANFLGLDNAATPFGLKAMESLQTLNPDKDRATNAQIMFAVLHASGLTLVPLSVMAQRAVSKAADPSDVFIPCVVATYVATVAGLVAVAIRQRIRLLNGVLLGWLGGLTAFLGATLGLFVRYFSKSQIERISSLAGNAILLAIIVAFVAYGVAKKINVYEVFIEGAKGGFQLALTIVPYLVGMLVAIGVLRNSGALDLAVKGLLHLFAKAGIHPDFAPALPVALMKPISGSGARALMIDAMNTYGPDSFVGRLSSVFQGSADTTFYVMTLYFGSVKLHKTRYALTFGLLAEFAGALAAIGVSYLFFH